MQPVNDRTTTSRSAAHPCTEVARMPSDIKRENDISEQVVRVLERNDDAPIKGAESLTKMMMLNAGRSRRASGCTLAAMDDQGISELATDDQAFSPLIRPLDPY